MKRIISIVILFLLIINTVSCNTTEWVDSYQIFKEYDFEIDDIEQYYYFFDDNDIFHMTVDGNEFWNKMHYATKTENGNIYEMKIFFYDSVEQAKEWHSYNAPATVGCLSINEIGIRINNIYIQSNAEWAWEFLNIIGIKTGKHLKVKKTLTIIEKNNDLILDNIQELCKNNGLLFCKDSHSYLITDESGKRPFLINTHLSKEGIVMFYEDIKPESGYVIIYNNANVISLDKNWIKLLDQICE